MRILLSSLFLLAFCITQAQDRKVRISHSSVSISDENFSETSVAINPYNTQHIVAGANVNHLFESVNGGRKWSHETAQSEYGVYGDPVLHFSGSRLYFAHLSKTKGKAYGDWFDRIVVQQIATIEPFIEKSYSVGYNDGKMQDKPWLSSDNHSVLHNGNVYVSWTEFDKYNSADPEHFSRIRFSKYTPEVDSFSMAITISDTVGNCMDGDETLEGATTAIGPNGEVYACWAGHGKIYFDQSLDGGDTWGKDQIIGSQAGGWNMDVPHLMRTNGMPFISTDLQNNIIYVCWVDQFFGDADLWLCYSKDGGQNWSEKIQVNRQHHLGEQFFMNMVFDDSIGAARMVYMDQSRSATGLSYDIGMSSFSALKYEAGQSQIQDFYVTLAPIPLPGDRFFFGDYIDLDCQRAYTVCAYPIYDGVQSNMGFSRFNTDSLGKTKVNFVPKLAAVADRDSVYLIAQIPANASVKARLKVKSKGGKDQLKIKKDFESNTAYQEILLGVLPLHSNEQYKVCLKYKIINLETQREYSRTYTLKR